jgi:RNA polymerase subunit RPABC4/transcription elongation factor Spt4
MTEETLKRHWTERRQRLQRIAAEVASYKECDHCRAILQVQLGICPQCSCYRFNADPDAVLATVKEMEKSPFPMSVGVPPRF